MPAAAVHAGHLQPHLHHDHWHRLQDEDCQVRARGGHGVSDTGWRFTLAHRRRRLLPCRAAARLARTHSPPSPLCTALVASASGCRCVCRLGCAWAAPPAQRPRAWLASSAATRRLRTAPSACSSAHAGLWAADLGHRWPGALPHHHDVLLPGRTGCVLLACSWRVRAAPAPAPAHTPLRAARQASCWCTTSRTVTASTAWTRG